MQSTLNDELDAEILATVSAAARNAPGAHLSTLSVYDIMLYHLGFKDEHFEPKRSDVGKRIRPLLCVLACEASDGDRRSALPMAAAIELLHNFTLIHDDIQDQSPLRRHRATVWSLWGIAQAINAGDAMFATAHLALLRSEDAGVATDRVIALSRALHDTTLRIVEGQVLDLGFETRGDVTADEYMQMIGGKSAAICRCACWAGATIAGSKAADADVLGEAGFALGVGFQLRDDILGIWGSPNETGKAAADDIRRRKKSLPILLLHERASETDRLTIEHLYGEQDVSPDGIAQILAMLAEYQVEDAVQEQAHIWHERASSLIHSALGSGPARDALEQLVDALVARVN
ncbi:MAG: polyprenyl synthetase family protein [Thermomicrobiales bacterium]|nr:polyprenyl synthetase family protein [Thermomicrobiales bacterium]